MIHRVRAVNLATASSNKIHDDEVARRYGFAGGLVPGVEVYAYATHAAVAAFGEGWLSNGAIDIKLVKPVYDGRATTVEIDEDAEVPDQTAPGANAPDSMSIVVRDEAGEQCATATAWIGAGAPPVLERAMPPLPMSRPQASAAALAPGTVLGTLVERFDADLANAYLAAIGEDLAIYGEERIAHPGWLLRRANRILAANVSLGPWIHVGSEVRNFDRVHDGDRVCTRAEVVREWERRGHRFVTLTVQIAAGPESSERLVVQTAHTAIYQPRTALDQ